MKSKFVRNLVAVLGAAALLVALVAVVPGTSSAANLTGGTYTYLIDGEEATFTFDPVVRKDGLLLPTEVFQKFGVAIEGATGKNITLSKTGVSARIVIGSTSYDLGGQTKTLATAPLRLNGRLFLPSDLLKEFGVDFSQDGNYISLRNYTDKIVQVKQYSDSDWVSMKSFKSFTGTLKSDSGANIYSEITLLNADLVQAANLNLTYGNRARLLGLLDTNTLVLIKASNLSNKAGGLVTTGFSLIDNQRNQYDVQQVLDIGSGLLSSKLSPSADRWGVLVFPKLAPNLANVIFYYDNSGYSVGTWNL